MGDTKGGAFDVPGDLARKWLTLPLNPNGRPNSDVLKPWRNGMDVTRRDRDMWIIDFGTEMSEHQASLYEAPASKHMFARAVLNRRAAASVGGSTPSRGQASGRCKQEPVVTQRSRYRVFSYLSTNIVPDHKLQVVTRDDDATPVFCSRGGIVVVVGVSSRHGVEDLTPSVHREPFPKGIALTFQPHVSKDARAIKVAVAAERIDKLRNAWLHPPDLVRIDSEIVEGYPCRVLPKDAVSAEILSQRTLTNLYSRSPDWLLNAHLDLDRVVAEAYGWRADISDDDALAALLELNLKRSAASSPTHKRIRSKRKGTRSEPEFKLPIAGGRQERSVTPREGATQAPKSVPEPATQPRAPSSRRRG